MVSFPDAVKMFFSRYVDFQGRSRRSEYWWVILFNYIVVGVLYAVLFTIGGVSLEGSGQPNVIGMIAGLLVMLYGLATLIPGIAIAVRRLHDRNMSGWFLLLGLLCIIPFIGFIVAIGFIVVFALPGTVGPNKFGPDPKNPMAGTADTFV